MLLVTLLVDVGLVATAPVANAESACVLAVIRQSIATRCIWKLASAVAPNSEVEVAISAGHKIADFMALLAAVPYEGQTVSSTPPRSRWRSSRGCSSEEP